MPGPERGNYLLNDDSRVIKDEFRRPGIASFFCYLWLITTVLAVAAQEALAVDMPTLYTVQVPLDPSLSIGMLVVN